MKYLPLRVIISDGEQGEKELAFYAMLGSFIEIINDPNQPNHSTRVDGLVVELDKLLDEMPDSSAKTFFTEQYSDLKEVRNLYG